MKLSYDFAMFLAQAHNVLTGLHQLTAVVICTFYKHFKVHHLIILIITKGFMDA